MKYEIFKLRGLEMKKKKKKKKAVLNLINTNILLLQANSNFNDVYLHFQVPRFLLKDSLGKLMNFLEQKRSWK